MKEAAKRPSQENSEDPREEEAGPAPPETLPGMEGNWPLTWIHFAKMEITEAVQKNRRLYMMMQRLAAGKNGNGT